MYYRVSPRPTEGITDGDAAITQQDRENMLQRNESWFGG